ncbi:MAG: cold shock domain-containing protein [Candidatus Omnitrophica bacterium]|nr:cold shock domain-containing protein [Candidatus Omnitrophota bacterium]
MAERKRNKVSWYSKARGYGFCFEKDNSSVFIHFSDLEDTFKCLEAGDLIEYERVQEAKGLRARNVKRITSQRKSERESNRLGDAT